jgi:DNA-binding MarR family transcriptional regulator
MSQDPATGDALGDDGLPGGVAETPDELELIRAALLSKGLADARQRAALGRQLHLTENEVLAIQYLALAGELTPGQLASQLQLSSGGTTGLIQRLERAGHVARGPNSRDKRSAIVRLTPKIATWATEAWQSYVADIDALAADLSRGEREIVRRFLEGAAQAAERHADRLARQADRTAHNELVVPLPALWA